MGYWPNKVKRRRHSWANNLSRKLVLLGATGSHSSMVLYGSDKGRKIWRTDAPYNKSAGRPLGWSKHYFLELRVHPDYDVTQTVNSRSMAGATIKGAKVMEII